MPDIASLLVARVVHIVASTIWVGGAILVAAFVLPAARASGPAGAAVLRELTAVRRLPEVLLGLAALTLVSGAYLLWVASWGLKPAWFHSRAGCGYTSGAAVALLAFLIGLLINIPTARRIGKLTREVKASGTMPTVLQAQMLQRRTQLLLRGTRAVATLVVASSALMSVARYL
jgi:uncharacterized membrane protein